MIMSLFRKREVKKGENDYDTATTEITGNLQSFNYEEICKKITNKAIREITNFLNEGLIVEYKVTAWYGNYKNITINLKGKIDKENINHFMMMNISVPKEIDLAQIEDEIIQSINKHFEKKHKRVEQFRKGIYTIF